MLGVDGDDRAAVGGGALSGPAIAASGPSNAERIADLGVLGLGLVSGIAASVALVAAALSRGEPRLVIGVGIYVAGLLAMLGCSLLYRATTETRRRQFFRRIDHAAIFAMIAGSATPFALARAGAYGIILAAALWAVAALGIVFKLRYPIGSIRRSALLYLLLGWASLVAVGPRISTETALLIAAGGAFYSVGVPFLLRWRLRYRLAIWHAFVLAGAACHCLAILDGVVFA
ncbi:MAG TPA: hemolysin III family protein [Stellaceae bacterium]|nr:hemolysin III family protein [Stellaceae bacterium]